MVCDCNSSDVSGTRTCLLGVPAYHNVAANEAWCKGCGGRRVFEIMDKIWRCGRVEFEGIENLEAMAS